MATTEAAREARLAVLNGHGRAQVEARTTAELCDMYVLAIAVRDNNISSGDDARAASRGIGWIAEELQRRDPAATKRWCDAEERIEEQMYARGEWIDGASDLEPHQFFGCDKPTA